MVQEIYIIDDDDSSIVIFRELFIIVSAVNSIISSPFKNAYT